MVVVEVEVGWAERGTGLEEEKEEGGIDQPAPGRHVTCLSACLSVTLDTRHHCALMRV